MATISKSRTWPFGGTSNTRDYLVEICKQLDEVPRIQTGIHLPLNASARDQHLALAEQLGLIRKEIRVYQLADRGHLLLQQDKKGQNRILHDAFRENIAHYRYVCDYINERKLERFGSSKDFHVQLARQSGQDFGVYIYDEISYKNVEYIMRSLGVISKNQEDGSISISTEFRVSFSEATFEEHVRTILRPHTRMYTRELCQRLERSLRDGFPGIDEKICYHELKRLSERGAVRFESGYPDAPVPAKHALISLGGEA